MPDKKGNPTVNGHSENIDAVQYRCHRCKKLFGSSEVKVIGKERYCYPCEKLEKEG